MSLARMGRIAVLIGVGLALLPGCGAPRVVPLRVLSYNIRHGEGMDGKIDLKRIARVIRATQADLVALQEVDRGVARSGRVDEPGRLARLTEMHAVFEKNINYQGGEYGNAVLSRFPVVYHKNHFLPQSVANEQRGVLEVHVRAGSRRVVFMATHLSYHPDDAERLASADMIRQRVEELGDVPVIIAGDFNATPDSRVLGRFLGFLQDTFRVNETSGLTFPANKPDRRIDYVLHNNHPMLHATDYRIIEETLASDHRPLLATFVLTSESVEQESRPKAGLRASAPAK